MSFLKSWQSLFVLFVLVLCILLLPYFFRFANGNAVFIGSESHYHARMASVLVDNPFISSDPLIGVPYHAEPYHYLLAVWALIIPVELASVFLPVLLGILSVLGLYLVLSKLKLKYIHVLFILFVFIFSPFFISCFSLSSPRAFIMFLSIFVFYFLINGGRFGFVLSLAGFVLLSVSDFFSSLLFLLVLLVFCIHHNKFWPGFYCFLALFVFVSAAFHLPFYLLSETLQGWVYEGVIADLGGVFGFSVFSLLLALLGFFFVWGSGKRRSLVYLLLFLIVIVSLLFNRFFIYSSLAVSFFAGSAFYLLFVRRWKLKPLKNFALLVLFCGFLFSALSHVIVLSELAPSGQYVKCLGWARENTPASSVFLAPVEDGFLIEFWAERSVLMDLFNYPDLIKEDTQIIWESFDLIQVRKLLLKHDVDFLVLREDWLSAEDNSGLALVLGNDETFKRKYSNNGCAVWEVIYEGK